MKSKIAENIENTFVIRFDLDTITCARSLKKLMHKAESHDFKFSLYINIGKSVSFSHALRRRIANPTRNNYRTSKLSILKKLGFKGVCETIALNPDLYKVSKKMIKRIKDDGHEIGLHGGTNHGIWQNQAHAMTEVEIKKLLVPALLTFKNEYGEGFGFTSPGFNVNENAYKILSQHGCKYVSDNVDKTGKVSYTSPANMPNIPVTLAAPGNVDYLESHIAKNSTETIEKAAQKLICDIGYGVYYSHPCFVTGPGEKIFDKFISSIQEIAKNETMDSLAKKLELY